MQNDQDYKNLVDWHHCSAMPTFLHAFFQHFFKTFSLLIEVLLDRTPRIVPLYNHSVTNRLSIHKEFFFDRCWLTDLNEYDNGVCHKL